MTNDRRRFMKQSAAIVSGLALPGCVGPGETPATGGGSESALPEQTLAAVGRLVLPSTELGEAGIDRVLEGFQNWLDEFEPVAELPHAYIWTDEILYGPAHPGPLFRAQLEALEIEAEKDKGASFTELSAAEQEAILRRQLPRDLPAGLPDAGRAPHVALGILAYFYDTSEANDLCYQAAIESQTCRGLESSSSEPAPKRS
jgi:hypothetical protein